MRSVALKKLYYTIFKNKDDSVVAAGTAEECARILGITLKSFRSFVSNTRSGRTKTYSVVVEDWKSQEEL